MQFKRTATFLGLACGTVLAISTSAQAASFTTSVSQNTDPRADVWLNSITQNGVTVDKFNLINEAKGNIIFNDSINLTGLPGETGNPDAGGFNNNTGAASTDRGDNASKPNGVEVSGIKDPTSAEIVMYLGNTNMNNIIDTEDSGSSEVNLFFTYLIQKDNTGLDNIFIWERGKNSDLAIQAIDENGNLIGNQVKLNYADQTDAGYEINTTEIGGTQSVGSWGINFDQLGVTSAAGIQLRTESNFNGPDYKVMARLGSDPILRTKIPEPATLLGLGLVGASLVASRRRKLSQVC